VKNMLSNSCFYRESRGNPCFPAKALGELFASSKVIPDPEFQSFDLAPLRAKDRNIDQEKLGETTVSSS
jgi:hypothetical protein